MKANKNQVKIIDTIISQLEYWKDSNDIESPTHISDLEAVIESMVEDDEILSYKQSDSISTSMRNVLNIIRKVKE